jgi:L-ascorbate metabolism protein UlaG (beta-lactamase superfamily)
MVSAKYVRAFVVGMFLVLTTASCAQTPPAPRQLSLEQWADDNLAIGYVGHATVLLKMTGTYILTDPAFFDRVGVTVGPFTIGPRRLVAPALALDRLPKLGAVVITHAHFDSLDLRTLRALPKDTTLIAPTNCRDLLGDLGFRDYVELGWGERTVVQGATIEAIPVKHWGNRYPGARARGYNGYVFSKDGARVLFASDTAYTEAFARFRDASPPLDVAIFGNGAYDPWIRNHADPEQVWRMFRESGARYLVPIHWDTFRLGKEPLGDAMRRLTTAAGPDAGRIVIREIGGEWFLKHPD